MKSVFGDFGCPESKKKWELVTSKNFKVAADPCCAEISWNGKTTFTKADQINEEYNVYKAEKDGKDIFMWWMWHGAVGHWVVNE